MRINRLMTYRSVFGIAADPWAPVITSIHNDSAVLVGTSDDKVLLQLRTEDGKEIWRADVKFNVFGSSALTANMCYTATLMGKIFGINLRTGTIFSPSSIHRKNTWNF